MSDPLKEIRSALINNKNRPDNQIKILDDLVQSLAFTIAYVCRGDDEAIGTMLMGIEPRLAERTAELAKAVRIFDNFTPRSRE